MLAHAGDNGNRAQRHLKLPRTALAQVTTHPDDLMAVDCLALAEPGTASGVGAAAQADPCWTSNKPPAGS